MSKIYSSFFRVIVFEIWEHLQTPNILFFDYYSSIGYLVIYWFIVDLFYTSYVRYIYKILVIWEVYLFGLTSNIKWSFGIL